MPTDIDAVMEFKNKVLVFWELKYGDAEIPEGQKLLYERIVDAWAQDGKEAVLFLCSHMTPSGEDIQLQNSMVTRTYYEGKWASEMGLKTAKERAEDFLHHCKEKHPKWNLNINETVC